MRRARGLFILPLIIVGCGTVLAIAGEVPGGAFFVVLGLVFAIAVAVTVRRESERADDPTGSGSRDASHRD